MSIEQVFVDTGTRSLARDSTTNMFGLNTYHRYNGKRPVKAITSNFMQQGYIKAESGNYLLVTQQSTK